MSQRFDSASKVSQPTSQSGSFAQSIVTSRNVYP